MILFRVDTSCGIGHLMRCKSLALAFLEQGINSTFVIDSGFEKLDLLSPFDKSVYTVSKRCELEDANFLVSLIDDIGVVRYCVVDSYRLGMEWESEVKKTGIELIALDDLERVHVADFIVDAKWQGLQTFGRYKNSTTRNKLLGPSFALLQQEYQQRAVLPRNNSILFSLGGGGDWDSLTDVIEALVASSEPLPFSIDVIIGPKAINTERLNKLNERHNLLSLHEGLQSVQPFFAQCGLFVGALGTSLYELAACNTPAITFSIAPNQQNDIFDLEALGHYCHLDSIDKSDVQKLVALIETVYLKRERLAQLRKQALVPVDGLGVYRVRDSILGLEHIEPNPTPSSLTAPQVLQLTEHISLRAVNDGDINHYLWARNRQDNLWRMTITDKIERIEHYNWWFNNRRESYVMYDEHGVLLYVWHQKVVDAEQEFLIGGWFAACDRVNFTHAQLVLEWQLTECERSYPKATWLAVINKDNRFVNLLNQRAGFVSLHPTMKEFSVTQRLFPNANVQEFNFVMKSPKADQL
ncbi:Spore coat polysaccharide biosynthesis protein predicted glycosyltransferase-like [Pseudoalteromonas luteoviolacea B = ATCC 29581]|nr:Spore coat polysaccharide biosynthesis protein predicted glycosyltransferase-like [Pseudoalteromonas luteoviolacea B = ATCC 29581]